MLESNSDATENGFERLSTKKIWWNNQNPKLLVTKSKKQGVRLIVLMYCMMQE